MASPHPRTRKMPVVNGSNALSQPAQGQPGVQRRCQVAHRQPEQGPHRITLPQLPFPRRLPPIVTQQAEVGSLGHREVLPRSRTEEQTRLPPLVERAPRPPCQPVRAASSYSRLPPLTLAPSAPTATFRDVAIGSTSKSQKQLCTTAAQMPCVPAHGSTVARPQSCQPAALRPTACATLKGTGNVSTVLCSTSAESRGLCQQAVGSQDPVYGRAAVTRRCTVSAANGSKATATQPAPAPDTCASTAASQSRRTWREAEQQPAMPAADFQGSLYGKSLGLNKKVLAKSLPPLPSSIETLQQPKGSCLRRAPEAEEHQAPLVHTAPAPEHRGFSWQAAAAQAQHQPPALHRIRARGADVQKSYSTISKDQFRDVAEEEAKVPFFAECGKQSAAGETQRQAPALSSSAENDTDLNVPSRPIVKKVRFREVVEVAEASVLYSHKQKKTDPTAAPKSILKKVRFRDVVEVPRHQPLPASAGRLQQDEHRAGQLSCTATNRTTRI
ncbi:uncharacterized protein [Melopsittacus undulatus]|uniref:uncharacterized protein n=1 Tax=Melopsittacus undulatus TaxID=13146 RepID=UPI00146C88B1|nr:uncharacterized protein LOC117435992 [Melopsittacus undulatus]